MSKANETATEWVLPAEIPFSALKSRDLEECVYWLLDAMGAKDLDWRTGGVGEGAPDGGRDLEARFYTPTMDGDIEEQRWWIECKGRTGTLGADEVKSAVLNAGAVSDLDYLVIVTNTQFSNPTRDWVSQWQEKQHKPKIKLWDRSQLERFLSRHPDVVLRLFSEALSLEGRVKALDSRFWNRMEFVPLSTLAAIWKARHSLLFEPGEMFAIIANEVAVGSVTHRPWAATLEPGSVIQVLAVAAQNMTYLAIRSSRTGIDQRILYRALAYLVLTALRTNEAKEVWTILRIFSTRGEASKLPRKLEEMIVMPVISHLQAELQDVCASNCKRIIALNRSVLEDGRDEVKEYWGRLDPDGVEEQSRQKLVRIERHDEPCVVGFPVGKRRGCPLFGTESSISNAERLLGILKRVADFRSAEADQKNVGPQKKDQTKLRPRRTVHSD